MLTRDKAVAWRLFLCIFTLLGAALLAQASFAAPKDSVLKPTGASPTATVPPTPTRIVCDVLAGNLVLADNISQTVVVNMQAVAAVSPGNVWTIQDGSNTMHWNGSGWQAVTNIEVPCAPPPMGDRPTYTCPPIITDLDAVSSDYVFAVGYYWGTGDILRSFTENWNGEQWIALDNAGFTNLGSVSAVSRNDAWAVGSSAIMHFDGNSWSFVSLPAGFEQAFLRGVAAISRNDVWMVGSISQNNIPSPVVLHWDGTAVTAVAAPGPSIQNTLQEVSGTSSTDIWVVGTSGTWHWNGTGWTGAQAAGNPRAVKAISPTDVWVVGNNIAHYDGSQWDITPSPIGNLYAIDASSSSDVWMTGAGVVRWDGTRLSTNLSPVWDLASNTLRDVVSFTASDAWAVGEYQSYFPATDRPLIEHWNGTAWTIAYSGSGMSYPTSLSGVAGTSSNDIWAVGTSYDGSNFFPWAMHYDGVSWEFAAFSVHTSDSYLSDVALASTNDAWAVGSYGPAGSEQPLIEHYDGAAWGIVYSSTVGSAGYLAGVDAVSADDVWAVGRYKPTASSAEQPLTMHWDGTQWTQVAAPGVAGSDTKLWSVSALATDDVWAVGYARAAGGNGQSVTLHWDGTQWSRVPSPNPGNGAYLWGVKATSPTQVWAVGNYANPATGVVLSLAMRWDGAQWQLASTQDTGLGTTPNYLYGVGQVIDNSMWAVGNYGTLDYTFTLTQRFTPPTFNDVQSTDYFYQAVQYLSCHGAISGYSDYTFRPYNNTTRGQLCKIVVLAEGWPLDTTGGPHFSDVQTGNPFYPHIETAYNQGIISGYADGTFRWGNNVTRGQLSKIIVQAEQWPIDTTGGPHFSDVPATDPFYGFIETAYNQGIISGYADGTFRPGNNATRGQISKIVYNAVTAP